MVRNPAGKSGFFNSRVLLASALCSVGGFLAIFSLAATPSSTITQAQLPTRGDESLFTDKYAGRSMSEANAVPANRALTPSAASGWSTISSANSPTQQTTPCTSLPVPYRCETWASTYDGAGHGADAAG